MKVIQAPPSSALNDVLSILEMVKDAKKTKSLLSDLAEAKSEYEADLNNFAIRKISLDKIEEKLIKDTENLNSLSQALADKEISLVDREGRIASLEFSLEERKKKIEEDSVLLRNKSEYVSRIEVEVKEKLSGYESKYAAKFAEVEAIKAEYLEKLKKLKEVVGV